MSDCPLRQITHLLVLSGVLFFQAAVSRTCGQDLWDPNRYIDLDEIQPGMEGVCRTCYRGATVEEFPVTVVSVVRGFEPGRDAILVEGVDPRFRHTGPVAGCSGSPVYIDGRLAGALAFGWSYSKDPLYGVTPIGEMLSISRTPSPARPASPERPDQVLSAASLADFRSLRTAYHNGLQQRLPQAGPSLAVAVGGLSAHAVRALEATFDDLGWVALSGATAGQVARETDSAALVPGASLVLPLMDGDISLAVVGTATEVRGPWVYAFGHSFLGTGAVDLPMATGTVHTVVSTLNRSFKLASPLHEVGAVTHDTPAGLVGQVGRVARRIPVTLSVEHFMQPGLRRYACRMAVNELLSPALLEAALSGAVETLGGYPSDHTLRYEVRVGVEGGRTLHFENLSANSRLNDLLDEVLGVLLLLQDNPYRSLAVESIEVHASLQAVQREALLVAAEIDDKTVRAGSELHVTATVEDYQGRRFRRPMTLTLPADLEPGRQSVVICGPGEYTRFLRQTAPQRFTALDIDSLLTALDGLLQIRRDRLYCVCALPADGVVVEARELPRLPATRAIVFQNTLRTVTVEPYRPWVEQSVSVDRLIRGRQVVEIEVEP